MGGRRIYHARGPDPRRLVEHQRPDLPARQPARLRALGGGPGHGDVGLRPLPAVLQEDGDVSRGGPGRPMARPRRATRPRARTGDQPAVHGVLRRLPGGRLRPDRGRQRLSPGGLRALRPEHPPRASAVGGAGLPEAGPRPQEPDRPDADVRDRRRVRGDARGRGRHRAARRRDGTDRGRRDHPRRRRDQHAAAAPAVGSRARPATWARSGSRSWPTCRASAPTSRTTSRSTSSTGASSRCRCSRPRRRSGAGRSSAPSGCSSGAGPGRRTISRAAASPGATTTSPTRT